MGRQQEKRKRGYVETPLNKRGRNAATKPCPTSFSHSPGQKTTADVTLQDRNKVLAACCSRRFLAVLLCGFTVALRSITIVLGADTECELGRQRASFAPVVFRGAFLLSLFRERAEPCWGRLQLAFSRDARG